MADYPPPFQQHPLSKLDPVTLSEVARLLGRGVSQTKVAKIFGVSQSAVCRWVASNPRLRIEIKREEERATDLVERSLFELATGAMTIERWFKVDPSGVERLVEVKEKHQSPNVAAAIYWLKNRRPSKWSERLPSFPIDDHGLPPALVEKINRMTPEQKLARIRELEAMEKNLEAVKAGPSVVIE